MSLNNFICIKKSWNVWLRIQSRTNTHWSDTLHFQKQWQVKGVAWRIFSLDKYSRVSTMLHFTQVRRWNKARKHWDTMSSPRSHHCSAIPSVKWKTDAPKDGKNTDRHWNRRAPLFADYMYLRRQQFTNCLIKTRWSSEIWAEDWIQSGNAAGEL